MPLESITIVRNNVRPAGSFHLCRRNALKTISSEEDCTRNWFSGSSFRRLDQSRVFCATDCFEAGVRVELAQDVLHVIVYGRAADM